MTITS